MGPSLRESLGQSQAEAASYWDNQVHGIARISARRSFRTLRGLRLDEDESAPPSGPALREPDPHESIGGPKRDAPSRVLALEDEELMAQSEHLGLECGPAAEHGSERCENGEKSRDHSRGSLGQIQEILNNDGPDQILGGTRIAGEII